MKRISVRIAAAVLGFFFGWAAQTVWQSFSLRPPMNTLSRDEAWHRLYEAAGMSGDADIRTQVQNRLLCANAAGVADAWPVEVEGTQWCLKADRTMHELVPNETSEYGSFYNRLIASHGAWASQNLDFIESISTAKSAKEYVARHELP